MSDSPSLLGPGQWFVLNGALYGRCGACERPILPSHQSVLEDLDVGAMVPPTKLAYHTGCRGAPHDVAEEALAMAVARFRAEMGEQAKAALGSPTARPKARS